MKGKLDEKPTMRSTLLFAQRFVPGFYEVTGNKIPSNNSRDLYSIRACTHHNLARSDYPSGVKETELMVLLRI
jgi:hypothetical protein